ncbi:hypothetical protein Vafri_7158 [Volvox africanus]|uniref:Uncharacterized protein n=1 Tax=Volvox africanus TaxID=51714 RepID=A0A8J4F085_9CHLO|nr:hypothetical protein Vafri_7158 [Volvox africanus]
MARTKSISTRMAAGMRRVYEAVEQLFTSFPKSAFKGQRVKQLPAMALVLAFPTSLSIQCHEWGWMTDRRLAPHLGQYVKNAYAVRQLLVPARQIQVVAGKKRAVGIRRPEAESRFLRRLTRLAWQMVLEPALQMVFGTTALYSPHMCNKGITTGLSKEHVSSWTATSQHTHWRLVLPTL